MRILLDTHAFLWAIADAVLLSQASLWEIAIKHSLAKADMPISTAQALTWAEASGFEWLPVAPAHLLVLETLPPHHRNPFDRLLIAQATCEALTLVSADGAFRAYGAQLQPADR